MPIGLELAGRLTQIIFRIAAEHGSPPLSVAVVDNGGQLKLLSRQDGCGTLRWEIAIAKAQAATAMNYRTSYLEQMAAERPMILKALMKISKHPISPVGGGVVIRSAEGEIIGAVGIAGAKSNVDEDIAVAAITEAGLRPDARD